MKAFFFFVFIFSFTRTVLKTKCIVLFFQVPNDFLADSCCEPVVEANYSGLSNWLISLGLPIYDSLFRKHGCTELFHIAALKDSDLHRYGIENSKHIRLLKTAIEALHIHIEHCQYVS